MKSPRHRNQQHLERQPSSIGMHTDHPSGSSYLHPYCLSCICPRNPRHLQKPLSSFVDTILVCNNLWCCIMRKEYVLVPLSEEWECSFLLIQLTYHLNLFAFFFFYRHHSVHWQVLVYELTMSTRDVMQVTSSNSRTGIQTPTCCVLHFIDTTHCTQSSTPWPLFESPAFMIYKFDGYLTKNQ